MTMHELKGYTLEGFTVLDAITFPRTSDFDDLEHEGVVLARSKSQYVTWRYTKRRKQEPSFFWGHYFPMIADAPMTSVAAAKADFYSRAAEHFHRIAEYGKMGD